MMLSIHFHLNGKDRQAYVLVCLCFCNKLIISQDVELNSPDEVAMLFLSLHPLEILMCLPVYT